MGRRMSPEAVEKYVKLPEDHNRSMYCPNNRYGYRININHSEIRPLYEAYKRKLGEHILSDEQRYKFEEIIFKMIDRRKNEQGNFNGAPDG